MHNSQKADTGLAFGLYANIVYTCIILYNITFEHWYKNYSFSDIREIMDDEDEIGDAQINGDTIGTIL